MCHVGTSDGLEIMHTCGGDQQPDRCGLKIIDTLFRSHFIAFEEKQF
jgi:hypothetical protein